MEKPAANLFENGAACDKEREYNFTNLIGEKTSYYLGWEEHLIETTCPICGNYIVVGHGYMDKWVLCPSCKIDTRGLTVVKYKEMMEEALSKRLAEQKVLNELIDKKTKIVKVLEEKMRQKNG